jgi:alpha-tubulin suppressor-like RCC1 family protein
MSVTRGCWGSVPGELQANSGRKHAAVQVSCGPYHAAAVASGGALFTWGDGFCGKLGHGGMQSCAEPRQARSVAHFLLIVASLLPA